MGKDGLRARMGYGQGWVKGKDRQGQVMGKDGQGQ